MLLRTFLPSVRLGRARPEPTQKELPDARRQEAQVAIRRRELSGPSAITVSEAAEDWLEGAKAGVIRTRSGTQYKPSALRGYERTLRKRLLPEIGHRRLSAITRSMLQGLVESWLREGLSASTVRNQILPIQAIYRRAKAREQVVANPTVGLSLPTGGQSRDRVAAPVEARRLLAALPKDLRPIWATALYAGLRRGELMALRWSDVHFERGLISVERGWDVKAGPIEPKSRAGRRRVPIASALRLILVEHRLRTGGSGDALVFGCDGRPFDSGWSTERARRAWRAAGLGEITLHECRHTCASLMIAAGVNAKALSTYLGHGSVTITLDRYGHLLPGNEREAASLLDRLLDGSGRVERAGSL